MVTGGRGLAVELSGESEVDPELGEAVSKVFDGEGSRTVSPSPLCFGGGGSRHFDGGGIRRFEGCGHIGRPGLLHRILASPEIYGSSPAFLVVISFGLSGRSRSRWQGMANEAREEGGRETLNKFGRVLVRLIRVGKARTEVKKGPAFCDMRSAGGLLMGG